MLCHYVHYIVPSLFQTKFSEAFFCHLFLTPQLTVKYSCASPLSFESDQLVKAAWLSQHPPSCDIWCGHWIQECPGWKMLHGRCTALFQGHNPSFFTGLSASSRLGVHLAEKQTKGPVARIWRPMANLGNAAIKPQSCKRPERQERRKMVKLAMKYRGLGFDQSDSVGFCVPSSFYCPPFTACGNHVYF